MAVLFLVAAAIPVRAISIDVMSVDAIPIGPMLIGAIPGSVYCPHSMIHESTLRPEVGNLRNVQSWILREEAGRLEHEFRRFLRHDWVILRSTKSEA